MFDHLYLLAEGQCIYQGNVGGLVPFLSSMGLECPSYHNPADYGRCNYLVKNLNNIQISLKKGKTISFSYGSGMWRTRRMRAQISHGSK